MMCQVFPERVDLCTLVRGKMEGSKTKRKQNCYRLGDEKVVDSVLPHGESFGIMESVF